LEQNLEEYLTDQLEAFLALANLNFFVTYPERPKQLAKSFISFSN